MKKDLGKFIFEKESNAYALNFHDVRRAREFHDTDIGGREGMKKRYAVNWHTKSERMNLNPIFGILRKHLGKKWDDVYSELCTVLDKRARPNRFIIDNVLRIVSIKDVFMKDGQVWIRGGGVATSSTPIEENSYIEYYVHPETRILLRNKNYKSYKQIIRERENKKAEEEAKKFRTVDKNNVLRLIDGVWYHFTLEKVPRGEIVFQKPTMIDKFNRNSVWSKKPANMVSWDELNQKEKERYGIAVIYGNSVIDTYTGKKFIRTRNGVFSLDSNFTKKRESSEYYNASKKTASHKMLKIAGII